VAFTEHLWREVSKCVEEISQQAINTRTVDGLAQFVIAENYLQGIEDPSLFYQQDSAVPAIVIKRHCLLEHRYNTRVIFNQHTRHPAPTRDEEVNNDDNDEDLLVPNKYVYTNIPSIDQFRGNVARALYNAAGRASDFDIQGTWEDREGLFQEELLFIPAYTPSEP